MWMGTFTPKLDEKGRLTLPAKFRDDFVEGMVITRGQERCLMVYAPDEFAKLLDPVNHAPTTLKQVRDYQRWLLAGASDEVPDRQGRVTVPPHLRSYAGLERDVVVVGAGPRLEVWNPQAWDEYSARLDAGFADYNDEIVPRS